LRHKNKRLAFKTTPTGSEKKGRQNTAGNEDDDDEAEGRRVCCLHWNIEARALVGGGSEIACRTEV